MNARAGFPGMERGDRGARRSAGYVEGALEGQMPVPGAGLPHAAGPSFSDDFQGPYTENWTATTIGGAGPTYSQQTPGYWSEIGIHRTATAATSGSGGVLLRSTVADLYRIPPPGSIWAVKLRMVTGTTSYDLWSGFASAAASVRTADATQFVGIRQDRAVGANLYGVVKSGAASETTVDLGITAEGSWRCVGFRVSGTVSAPSVQFLIFELTNRLQWTYEEAGDPVTTTMPATTLFSCALGVVARTNATRTAEIDFWNLGGRTIRLP